MKTIAIITARGGSKRIPQKNRKDFCGKPILAYSVEAAVSCGIFDEVMVSTDDSQIAAIAEEYGAKVPFYRSEKTSNDYATTTQVLLEVLEEYEKRGQSFDAGACLYPTAPFVTAKKLQKAAQLFEDSEADTLIPVVRFSYPPQRAMVMKDGFLTFQYPQYLNSRSQDLDAHYHDAGQFYFFRTEALRQNQSLMVGRILPFEISEMEVQDIDSLTDWKIAEIKYQMMMEQKA